MASYAYLKPDNLEEVFKASKAYTNSLTDKFWEYERISRNLPIEGIDPAYPKTTDGTTASIIRKTPHRIIQQLPTGTIKSDQQDWLSIVANFIFNHKIIPYANENYALLQKCWNMVERALTFGFCPIYTPFVNHHGYLCTDMRLPYWGDVFMQPGKLSDTDSQFIFLRSWWTKEDIEALIDKQNQLKKSAKSRKETLDSGWDTSALSAIKGELTSKDEKAQPPNERTRNKAKENVIELVTGFQRGVKGKFYTFHPRTGEVVRTKVNRDPRGEIPINFMYADIDGSNPFGRGIVELVGPMQNLMDAEIQMYQYNRAYNLNPALLKRGNFSKNKIKLIPNIVIDLGSEPTADVKPLTIDSAALQNFGNNYGLMKSQLLNLLSSPDTSVSADSGNPGFSKTPQGVQQIQANVSVDDNYVRKLFELAYQNWGETAINVYFGERTGIEELQLDKETASRLRNLKDFDPTRIDQDNNIKVDYKTATEVMSFRVDPSTSTLKDDQHQAETASTLLDMVMKYPQLNSNWGGPIDVDELSRRVVINSSIDDPEQVAPEPTEQQKAMKEQSKNKPSGFSPMFDKPKLDIRYPDLPPAAQVQLLGLAGIQVTTDDIMQGAVLDPNMRGVMNPVSDPNILMPGEQPGQPANSAGTNPIDIGDIYKATTDPLVKAQIEKMAGLQPDLGHVTNQVASNDATAAQQTAPTMPPPEAGVSQSPQGNQYSPEDQQLIAQMQQMGIPDQDIGRALAMMHHGYSLEQILSSLGVGGQASG